MAGSSSLVLRYAARSDVGKVRAKNDDSAYAGRYLAVVADGMGGHAGGDVASASTVLDLIHLDRGDYQSDAGTQLADEIQTANALLSEMVHVNPKLTGMGTTVTALLLSDDKLAFAHIGDSRAYRLKAGVFEQLSVDHTFVQRLIDEGRLSPEEAETHPHKNVLMRVLGDVDASPELDLTSFEASPGERWLLCSDGLNFVDLQTVEQVVRETPSLAVTAERLIELTLDAGSPDNVTVVMVEVAESGIDDVNTDRIQIVPPASQAGSIRETLELPEDPDLPGSEDFNSDLAADHPDPAYQPGPAKERGEQLGVHITAEVVREDLSSRPHELVGAAVTAAEDGRIPMIAGRSTAKRAAAVLTHKPEQSEEGEELLIISEPPRRPRWFALAAGVLAILILGAGTWWGYAWTQTRYYVGESNGKVAIYNGISQSLGPITLSHVYTETPVTVDSLPAFSQQRLQQTLPAATLLDANQIVSDLQLGVVSPPGTGPSRSPSPATSSPSSSAPSASPSASPSCTPLPSGNISDPSANPCPGGTP